MAIANMAYNLVFDSRDTSSEIPIPIVTVDDLELPQKKIPIGLSYNYCDCFFCHFL